MGTDIPEGSTVLVNTYILHRDPRHFPSPEVFDPKRFLPSSPKPPSFAFIPFSAGSRNCIGWKFAQMEVKVIVLSVLRAFEVRAVQSEDQLKLISELVLLNRNGVRLTITPRNSEMVWKKNQVSTSLSTNKIDILKYLLTIIIIIQLIFSYAFLFLCVYFFFFHLDFNIKKIRIWEKKKKLRKRLCLILRQINLNGLSCKIIINFNIRTETKRMKVRQ